MNYNSNPGVCALEVFKPSGKWYQTLELDLYNYYSDLDGFEKAIIDQHPNLLNSTNWILVCIDPYLKHEYPRLRFAHDVRKIIEREKNNGV